MFIHKILLSVAFCLGHVASSPVKHHSTSTSITAAPSASIDAAYTSSLLSSLWAPLNVSYADVTTVAEPTPIPSTDLIAPPVMPKLESQYRLPADFLWGLAGAAFQNEGAVDADGRGPSVWDTLGHLVDGFITDGTTGDIADNHYYLYKQDAQRLKAIGIKTYSLSVSWTRIFPFGNGTVNEAGLNHYIDEVNYLISLGIEPVVTLFHFDLPQTLQDWYYGFLGEQIVDDYANYARTVFEALAPLGVKTWITMNEPELACSNLYPRLTEETPAELFARPNLTTNEIIYKCGHNTLLAHAKAVDILRKEIEPVYGPAKVSYKGAWFYSEPLTNSTDDIRASQRQNNLAINWFGHPVWKGDYSDLHKEILGDILPKFSKEEIALVKSSVDFYAHDFYNGHYYTAPDEGFDACVANVSDANWPSCAVSTNIAPGGWPTGPAGGTSHNFNTPQLFRDALRFINATYAPNEIIITEFGFPVYHESQMELGQARYDLDRTIYFQDYLREILGAYNEDKIPIKGAIAWGTMDNLEWNSGLEVKFGLQYVNYTTQERYYKQSLHYLTQFFDHYIQ
ncbi:unnamed protein product [Kuraishia capsulata CBS 1993]|uniref:Glycoside hydrolase family 1 protein n=1 Tax=Kuraishia capsulata CBS 1993 TaxID=1382522 RepID=W6MPU3_9ASCO|nr:uncharacterized protein KUCA_T00004340001 [Kuraishia capsulata CBS 1993]CDK28358.1 unnamed protein product [Kuraishia capsulata CBS 1993]